MRALPPRRHRATAHHRWRAAPASLRRAPSARSPARSPLPVRRLAHPSRRATRWRPAHAPEDRARLSGPHRTRRRQCRRALHRKALTRSRSAGPAAPGIHDRQPPGQPPARRLSYLCQPRPRATARWPVGHSREEGAHRRKLSLAADDIARVRPHHAPHLHRSRYGRRARPSIRSPGAPPGRSPSRA